MSQPLHDVKSNQRRRHQYDSDYGGSYDESDSADAKDEEEATNEYLSETDSEEDEEEDRIQQIIGIKSEMDVGDDDDPIELKDIPNDKIQFYVKWANKSHIHDTLMNEEEVYNTPGGEKALKKFRNRSIDGLSKSHSKSDIYTIYQEDINAGWTLVERIIGQNDRGEYFVKWLTLPYEEATWEKPQNIPDYEEVIKRYQEHINHTNNIYLEPSRKEIIERKHLTFKELTASPVATDKSTLRKYQVAGVNWLRECWYEGRNAILADEMGLGKTVQIVSTLACISKDTGLRGPFLIISPLSTLMQWKREIERWSDLYAVIYHGKPNSKDLIFEFEFPTNDDNPNQVNFDVIITNYETFTSDYHRFKEIQWRFLILDEGHRLKNHQGKCYQLIQALKFEQCFLLTGTPIQNNVEELWSLLHLLHPEEFDDLPAFMESFGQIDDVSTLKSLQELIQPYILRRKKNDVESSIATKEETIIEVELTRIQRTYYQALLHDNASVLLHQITGGSLPSLQNLMMQLRKVCNHPFLIKGATQHIEKMIADKLGPGATEDEIALKAIVESSGKMILIDKLLPKLRNGGHKVLIFSQMVKVLDIIEEYLNKKDIQCERIDGNVPEPARNAAIERFVNDEDIFVFLLCTRAGGVGINLTAADTVIIHDSDWNPQNDVQAQSRCHRIGQTQKVKVYRLVTRGTYELQMLDRASRKLGLDHALLDGGELSKSEPVQASELEKLLRYGVHNIMQEDDTEIDRFCEADIDQILDRNAKEKTTEEAGTLSLFSKMAKFDTGKAEEPVESTEFWKNVLPAIDDIPLEDRRCKKNSKQINDEPDSYSDYEEDVDEVAKARKKQSPISIRKTIKRMIRIGLGNNKYHRAIAYFALKHVSSFPDSECEYCCKMLDIPSPDAPKQEYLDTLDEFSSNLNDVADRAHSILKRIVMFDRIGVLIRKLQGPVDSWPVTESSTPLEDYTLLLGVFRNGLGSTENVLDGLGVANAKVGSMRCLEKRLSTILNFFDEKLKDVEVPPIPLPPFVEEKDLTHRPEFTGEEMMPDEWRAAHPNLYNRTEMTTDETLVLYQTLLSFGLVYNANGSIDWECIRNESHLFDISIEAIKEAGQRVVDTAMLPDDQLDAAIEDIRAQIGINNNKIWYRKLRNCIQDLNKVREFVDSLDSEKIEAISHVKHFNASHWWEAEHDLALLQGLAEFGHLRVSYWLVRKQWPFRKLIPEESIDDFEKCAEIEAERNRPQKPHDMGPLAFVYKDRLRINRATFVIRSVENYIERLHMPSLKYVKPYYEQPKNKPTTTQSHAPLCPFYASDDLTIFSWGQYINNSPYPIGFSSGMRSVPYCPLPCTIKSSVMLGMDGKMVFQVIFELCGWDPLLFLGGDIDSPFRQLKNVLMLNNIPSSPIPSEWAFGFRNATVMKVLEQIKNQNDRHSLFPIPAVHGPQPPQPTELLNTSQNSIPNQTSPWQSDMIAPLINHPPKPTQEDEVVALTPERRTFTRIAPEAPPSPVASPVLHRKLPVRHVVGADAPKPGLPEPAQAPPKVGNDNPPKKGIVRRVIVNH